MSKTLGGFLLSNAVLEPTMPKRKPIENRTPLAAWSIACRERYGWSQMTAADEAGIDQGRPLRRVRLVRQLRVNAAVAVENLTIDPDAPVRTQDPRGVRSQWEKQVDVAAFCARRSPSTLRPSNRCPLVRG